MGADPATLTIALDAMGGDDAPAIVVDGAALARERIGAVRFALFGDQARLRPLLDRHGALIPHVEVHHCASAIPGDMKPGVALRQGKDSSMRRAIDAVKAGEAAAMVSAGNTGALMAMAKIVLRTLPGIDRPAICSVMPTQRGESVMLDLGANAECSAGNLVQFALMGGIFAQIVLGARTPSIGLLNIGSEDMKGTELLQDAAAALRQDCPGGTFHGFVEGDDITRGSVDVVVTDGFTGNVALKTAEGTAKLVSHFLREALTSSLLAMAGAALASGALKRVREQLDPRRHNGAMLVGLNGVCVKSHGGTDALGYAHACEVAADLARHDVNRRIAEAMARLSASDAVAGERAAV